MAKTGSNGAPAYGTAEGARPGDPPPDPAWVVALRDWTGAAPASSERLDVAKFVFILLVCAGHWCEPFYKIGNKPTQAFMHAVYGFHVPAFVLISGYVSGDLNPKRRRALIGGIVVPFLVLHVLYSVAYTKMFCERDDGRPACQFVNNWSLVDPVNGQWDGWDKWTFAYPFAHLWYLVSLVTKRVWRPFALEMRWTLLLHVVGGVLVGYTTVGRFLSLHRSTVHMPYFLCGYLMRKHRCFFPEAVSFTARALATASLAIILGAAWAATYAWDMRVEVWFQSDPHDAVYDGRWAYGALYQLGLYAWTFFTMAVAFALVPEPTTMGVKYPGEDDAAESAGLLGDVSGGGDAGKRRAARRAGRYGKERDQDDASARAYLRVAKWGSRTLYPFVLHIGALMCVAKFTDWYEITWHAPGTSREVTARFACTFVACCITTIILSLRPVVGAFKWLLEPDVRFMFSPELQKV